MTGQLPNLTTTSYVILGHLALRSWSTYELARQMTRSTRHYWPRTESKIYEEPKKLVAHGFATATREHTGRRPRKVYAITGEGRQALRHWLDKPGKMPLVEFEGAVKVLFAEQGTREQLLATLRSIREQAEQTRAEHSTLAHDLAQTGGPFPDRLHVNSLVFKFMWEQTEAVIEWAAWAEDEVASWPQDITRPTGPHVPDVLREAANPQPHVLRAPEDAVASTAATTSNPAPAPGPGPARAQASTS
ncbi:MAG: PadR family transcriptional regulator [Actinomycetota bacterium]|nr:PadR family transcriptional regulator [Actinomycetota bacterium]